jgi:hypothetical protein
MTDEEVLIGPLAGGKVARSSEFADLLFGASKLYWVVHGHNVIELSVRSDFGEIIGEGAVVLVSKLILEGADDSES